MPLRRPNYSGLYLVGIGVLLLLVFVAIGFLFGASPRDVLLVRGVEWAMSVSWGYVFIILGAWITIKPLIFPNDPQDVP